MKVDFGELALECPDLEKYFGEDGRFEFHLDGATYALSEAILKVLFDVNIQLDRSRLCPRIPNRLAYIDWCIRSVDERTRYMLSRSLHSSSPKQERWVCIDIGTGSSAIYAILGTLVDPNCKFIGSEIDSHSVDHARAEIQKNNLVDRINIVKVESANDILESISLTVADNDEQVSYTMCNPPFYESIDSLVEHSRNKPKRHNDLVASESELVHTDGGEYGFITKYVDQSIKVNLDRPHQFKHCLFTCQIGLLSTVKQLDRYMSELKKQGLVRLSVIQGLETSDSLSATKRWAIGWTVGSQYRLPPPRSLRCSVSLEAIFARLQKLEFSSVWYCNGPTREPIADLADPLVDSTANTVSEQSGDIYFRCFHPMWTRKYSRIQKFQKDRLQSLAKHECVFRISQDSIIWVYGDDSYTHETFVKWINQS